MFYQESPYIFHTYFLQLLQHFPFCCCKSCKNCMQQYFEYVVWCKRCKKNPVSTVTLFLFCNICLFDTEICNFCNFERILFNYVKCSKNFIIYAKKTNNAETAYFSHGNGMLSGWCQHNYRKLIWQHTTKKCNKCSDWFFFKHALQLLQFLRFCIKRMGSNSRC